MKPLDAQQSQCQTGKAHMIFTHERKSLKQNTGKIFNKAQIIKNLSLTKFNKA